VRNTYISEEHFGIANVRDIGFLPANDANKQLLIERAGVVVLAAKPGAPNLAVRSAGALNKHLWPSADVTHNFAGSENRLRT
jgi:hypothetical protein